MPESYPLQWPAGWRRTEHRDRKAPVFAVTLGKALDELYAELERMKATDIVVSSSMRTRLDGRPLAKSSMPDDPGVAVYFTLAGRQQCIPCDKWSSVLGNVRAVGLTVAALRGLERWGAKDMVDAAFAGFKALPGGDTGQRGGAGEYPLPWYEVLGVAEGASQEEIKKAYLAAAHEHHPDKGGDRGAWNRIADAYRAGSGPGAG